ncbi:MAG: hypothetical protein AVDCRST_MAG19-676 [uncultured Thermomicrobiales bacterium]|uniref:Uncharacterized protein n=1 Tax=uncultured Thermomicrobiales bacterium TaxID=1645740 RepID=A0A6J4UFX1_9BACT|nr:MAG: hypothetical protein AVDCRST_MAG19-676 [uncultured Thermomicrobiales bacterium]
MTEGFCDDREHQLSVREVVVLGSDVPRMGPFVPVRLGSGTGEGATGRRRGPGASPAFGNRAAATVVVADVATLDPIGADPFPGILAAAGGTGLNRTSTVVRERSLTAPEDRSDRSSGAVPPALMARLDVALRAALGLRSSPCAVQHGVAFRAVVALEPTAGRVRRVGPR